MKAPINFNRHHRETSNKSSKCSFVSVFLCMWLLTMLGGSAYFFRDAIAPVQDASPVISTAPSGSDSVVDASDVTRAGGDGGLRREPVHLVPQAPAVDLVVKPLPGLRLGAPEAARRNVSITLKPKPKPPAPQLPLLKTKDMWSKTAVEQREYLQSIHSDKPPPSTRAADEFLQYVADANAGNFICLIFINSSANSVFLGVSSKKPVSSVFDTPYGPRDSPGKPGDSNVLYHIAGLSIPKRTY